MSTIVLTKGATPPTPQANDIRLFFNNNWTLCSINDTGVVTEYGETLTNEQVMDIIGNFFTDTNSINATYDDAGNTVYFDVKEAGVDHDSLKNYVANKHIDHSAVSISAGTGLSGGGDLTTTRTISMPNVGTAGTYGEANVVPVFTTDAQGRVTQVTNTNINITHTNVSDFQEEVSDIIHSKFNATNTFYVIKNGNDASGDGTLANPFLTIKAALGAITTNGAQAYLKALYVSDCGTGILADTEGENPIITMSGVSFHGNTVNFNIANTTASGSFTGYSEYAKTSINASSSFFITGIDPAIITVGKKGADFTSLSAAIAAITPTSNNPYLIKVGPGTFIEPPITMKAYLNIEGVGADKTIITCNESTGIAFTGIPGTQVYGLTINGTTGIGGTCVKMIGSASTASFILNRVKFGPTDNVAILDCSNTGVGVITTQYCELPTSWNKCYEIIGGGNLAYIVQTNSMVNHLSGSSSTPVFAKVHGAGARVIIGMSMITNYTANGYCFHCYNGGNISTIGSSFTGFAYGVYNENTGSGCVVRGISDFVSTQYDFYRSSKYSGITYRYSSMGQGARKS